MAIVNITCENDADFNRGFLYQAIDSNGNVTGPIDLTGYTMQMGIRQNATDITEEMLLTTANGGLAITDPVNGAFTVLITQAQLVAMELGDYAHSLIRMQGTAKLRVWSGTLTINPGPSR
jgi:hypothetical protein